MIPGEMATLVTRVSELCRLGLPTASSYDIGFSLDPWAETIPSRLEAGFETLGVYQHEAASGRITVYAEKCRQFAVQFGWLAEEVGDIVLIHEVSHMVHHLGRDQDQQGRFGECFGKNECSEKCIEMVAQETTFAAIRKFYPTLEPAFKGMSERSQPSEYNAWHEFADLWGNSAGEAEDQLASKVQALRAVDRICLLNLGRE